jgi:hypothetical protein
MGNAVCSAERVMNASARVTIEPEAADRPQRREHSIAEKRRIVEATWRRVRRSLAWHGSTA